MLDEITLVKYLVHFEIPLERYTREKALLCEKPYQYTEDQADALILRPNSEPTIKTLLSMHADLVSMGLTHSDLVSIAAHDVGGNELKAFNDYFTDLCILGTSKKDIIAMAASEGGAARLADKAREYTDFLEGGEKYEWGGMTPVEFIGWPSAQLLPPNLAAVDSPFAVAPDDDGAGSTSTVSIQIPKSEDVRDYSFEMLTDEPPEGLVGTKAADSREQYVYIQRRKPAIQVMFGGYSISFGVFNSQETANLVSKLVVQPLMAYLKLPEHLSLMQSLLVPPKTKFRQIRQIIKAFFEGGLEVPKPEAFEQLYQTIIKAILTEETLNETIPYVYKTASAWNVKFGCRHFKERITIEFGSFERQEAAEKFSRYLVMPLLHEIGPKPRDIGAQLSRWETLKALRTLVVPLRKSWLQGSGRTAEELGMLLEEILIRLGLKSPMSGAAEGKMAAAGSLKRARSEVVVAAPYTLGFFEYSAATGSRVRQKTEQLPLDRSETNTCKI